MNTTGRANALSVNLNTTKLQDLLAYYFASAIGNSVCRIYPQALLSKDWLLYKSSSLMDSSGDNVLGEDSTILSPRTTVNSCGIESEARKNVISVFLDISLIWLINLYFSIN